MGGGYLISGLTRPLNPCFTGVCRGGASVICLSIDSDAHVACTRAPCVSASAPDTPSTTPTCARRPFHQRHRFEMHPKRTCSPLLPAVDPKRAQDPTTLSTPARISTRQDAAPGLECYTFIELRVVELDLGSRHLDSAHLINVLATPN